MKVAEIMHRNPTCVEANETLINIAKKMKNGDFGSVIVNENNRSIGIVTDRDIVTKALTKNTDIKTLTAKDIMSEKLISCSANDSFEAVVNKMKSNKIRRVPVLDENNKTIGIVSLGDMALAEKGKEFGPVFEALERISQHPAN
jgi:CBS domain-containing protein